MARDVQSSMRGNLLNAFDNDIDARSDNLSNAREGAHSSATRPTKTGMLSAGSNPLSGLSGQPGGQRVFEMPASSTDQDGGPGGVSFDHLAESNQPDRQTGALSKQSMPSMTTNRSTSKMG